MKAAALAFVTFLTLPAVISAAVAGDRSL